MANISITPCEALVYMMLDAGLSILDIKKRYAPYLIQHRVSRTKYLAPYGSNVIANNVFIFDSGSSGLGLVKHQEEIMCYQCNYAHLLENSGLGSTPNRLKVLEVIGNNNYPLNPREIIDILSRSTDINCVTVYRILDLLVEKNLLIE